MNNAVKAFALGMVLACGDALFVHSLSDTKPQIGAPMLTNSIGQTNTNAMLSTLDGKQVE